VKKPSGEEELSIRKQLVKLSKRKLLVKKQSGKKAKLKITLADTRGRDADIVSVGTSTISAVQTGGSIKSADTPVARLSQAASLRPLQATQRKFWQLQKACQHP
jgi:hypothetical protein